MIIIIFLLVLLVLLFIVYYIYKYYNVYNPNPIITYLMFNFCQSLGFQVLCEPLFEKREH